MRAHSVSWGAACLLACVHSLCVASREIDVLWCRLMLQQYMMHYSSAVVRFVLSLDYLGPHYFSVIFSDE